MSWELPDRTYRLVFTHPSMAGLEVDTYELDSERYEDIAELALTVQEHPVQPGQLPSREVMVSHRRLREGFAATLAGWNLTRRGKPVPATVESLRGLPLPFTMALVMAWLDALGGAALRAQADAQHGEELVEASLAGLPMTVPD
jgi:hypothetical protein